MIACLCPATDFRNPHAGYGNCYEQAPVSCIDLLIAYQHAPVDTQKKPGVYTDGGGLYLRVKSETAKSWVFVWHVPTVIQTGRAQVQAPRNGFGLNDPRKPGQSARARPASARGGRRRTGPSGIEESGSSCAYVRRGSRRVHQSKIASIRSDKSIARWERAIGDGGYAKALRTLRVDKITTADVVNVLKPMWQTHPSSAGLLRGYIEAVPEHGQGPPVNAPAKIRRLGGPSGADTAGEGQAWAWASCCYALLRGAGVYGGFASAGQPGRACTAAHDPLRHSNQRNSSSELEGVRPKPCHLDHSGRSNEGRKGTSHPPVESRCQAAPDSGSGHWLRFSRAKGRQNHCPGWQWRWCSGA